MTETVDAGLLKDQRGLGKPPSFDGNDAEYQDFRFIFRIRMSLVSSASQPLMDKCEVERNPISLASVKLCDTHLKLITKSIVRTFFPSVSEFNGAEALRQIHHRCARDAPNRQYASMQKITMPAKFRCDHAEGFESGLRAWELVVGDCERASGTALEDAVKYTVMNMAPFFFGAVSRLGT